MRDVCAVCGNPATSQWTLDDGDRVYVAELCDMHEAPLVVIGASVGTKPPPTIPEWKPPVTPARKRHSRLEPLTGWKPPEKGSGGPEVLFLPAT